MFGELPSVSNLHLFLTTCKFEKKIFFTDVAFVFQLGLNYSARPKLPREIYLLVYRRITEPNVKFAGTHFQK